jgi:hypothetical protein
MAGMAIAILVPERRWDNQEGRHMKLEVDLKPETGEILLAKARAEGLSLDEIATRALDFFAQLPTPAPVSPRERVPAFDAFVEGLQSEVVLPDDALQRENWYPDR